MREVFAGKRAGPWRLVAAVPEASQTTGDRVLWLGLQNTSKETRIMCVAAWWYGGDVSSPRGGVRAVSESCLADSEFVPVLPADTAFIGETVNAETLGSRDREIWIDVTVSERGGRVFEVPWHGTARDLLEAGRRLGRAAKSR
jgi:hypothetical protein